MRYFYRNALVCGFLLASAFAVQAQKAAKAPALPAATPAQQRLDAFAKRKAMKAASLAKGLPFRNVGPTIMSGRIADLDVNPAKPSEFFVAFASGGLWKSTSNGSDFAPLFDHEASMTLGDVAVHWPSNTIWLGTGENNSSRSSYAGTGIYKSSNGGQSWECLGLAETQHIGRIVVHPADPNTAWVGAMGHLYSPNKERGVYKTSDGGKTWQQTLFINERTGIIDLVMDPSNPNVLYAAAWERMRSAWDFEGNGAGTAIHKSTDGGNTWKKLDGFATTPGYGRIGLDISASNPNLIYAVLDNQDRREKDDKKQYAVTKASLEGISKEAFLALSDADINDFLDREGFPSQYNAVDIKEDVKQGKLQPKALLEFLADANSLLFDTPVKGAEVFRSADGGATWQKAHEGYIEDLVYSYGYYFGQVRIDPADEKRLYLLGVPVLTSKDAGKTWESISPDNVHADHHALWLNPALPGHLVLGNDGGLNISYDYGKTYFKCNSIPVGQFYSVNVDMAEPYNVYGGLQDNGVWVGPSTYEFNRGWEQDGEYPYKRLMGGDGMQVVIDPRDNNTVYTGYQFGNYYRVDKATGKSTYITPMHKLGERPYRFNWQAPIHLSKHNPDVVYFGSHRFHRSLDKGASWETLSGDLTQGGKPGNVPYGTLTSIHESPLRFGLIYAASDDGLVHVSKDAGYTWERITAGLPANYWVSRVQASAHQEGRVYLSLNGYRYDNFEALCYVSEDYGRTWQRIGLDLPAEPVNVIKEDPKNADLLYVGTDHGAYFSLDRGKAFMAFDGGLPDVAVHDLVIHPRENDLVLGTHGRSIFIGNVSLLQKLDKETIAKQLHVFDLEAVTQSNRWGKKGWNAWMGFQEAKAGMAFYAQTAGKAALRLKTANGTLVREWAIDATAGLNMLDFDCRVGEGQVEAYRAELQASNKDKQDVLPKSDDGHHYLAAGKFVLEVEKGGTVATQAWEVKPSKERPARKPQKKTP